MLSCANSTGRVSCSFVLLMAQVEAGGVLRVDVTLEAGGALGVDVTLEVESYSNVTSKKK